VPTAAVDILQFCLLMLSTAQVPTAAVDILQFCLLMLSTAQVLTAAVDVLNLFLLMLSTAQVPTAAVDVSKAVQQPLDISQPALTTEVAGGDGVEVSVTLLCFVVLIRIQFDSKAYRSQSQCMGRSILLENPKFPYSPC
jgi:hypothetical protein